MSNPLELEDRPRVLVVDDEPQIQRFLRPSLAASGFDVVSAAGVSEGMAAFEKTGADIVILDLGLPDADGTDCCLARKSM